MRHHGISVECKNVPVLDPGFSPFYKFRKSFLQGAEEPFGIALVRNNGQTSVCNTFIHGGTDSLEADAYYIDRMIKFLLWMKGGYKVLLCGSKSVAQHMIHAYSKNGSRAFDQAFMSNVYQQPFSVEMVDELPKEYSESQDVGYHLDGCRIGFDAGGSDWKVSAVIDGTAVFSSEVVWHPKTNSNPDYHFSEITKAFRLAQEHMPRVDAVGISSAGIFINNRTRVASLFLQVAPAEFEAKVQDIYIRAAKEIGDVPVCVCNDGDVTALAGVMSMEKTNMLGIAMGTSEAAGYVNNNGSITGWLNELAFAPVDVNPNAMRDEWSGDIGCGVKYFSQDGVVKLADRAGFTFDEALTQAEKLKAVQNAAEEGDMRALRVFADIGVYLGHSLPLYEEFYGFRHVLLLGRVMSGKGGEILCNRAREVLAEEYPELAANIEILLPTEKMRRVGQSVAAASLPKIG